MYAKYLGQNIDTQYRNAMILIGSSIFFVIVGIAVVLSSSEMMLFREMAVLLSRLWWIILPLPMYLMMREAWGEYRELMWVIKQKFALIEVRPPADIEKSPKIMEHVFTSLHDYTTPSRFEHYCGWKPFQSKYTFEIVSLEGVIHYYIRTPVAARNHVEAQIYSQYPDAEIYEVEDYVWKIPRNLPNAEYDVWGTAFQLVNPNPAYPLRTYKKFQEEVTGEMVDPMANLNEVFSQLKKGQYGWLQIVFDSADAGWYAQAREEMDRIAKKTNKNTDGVFTKVGQGIGLIIGNVFRSVVGAEMVMPEKAASEEYSFFKLTPAEQELLKVMQERVAYNGYNCLIRYVYISKRETFSKPLGVASVIGSLKAVNDSNYNSITPDNRTKTFAWYFFEQPRLEYRKRKIVNDFRGRDFAGLRYVLNAPELATIYHFPSKTVKAPTVQRVEAKKGEAPFNLPIAMDQED